MIREPKLVYCLLLLLVTAAVTAGPSEDKALAVCYAAQNNINTLATFTYTRCWPALKGGYGFLVISEKPVLAVPSAKKGWLLTVVAAIGAEMNQRNIDGTELMVSDVARTKNRVAWSVPLAVVRNLQRRIKRDEITLDQMYSVILSNMKEVRVPPH